MSTPDLDKTAEQLTVLVDDTLTEVRQVLVQVVTLVERFQKSTSQLSSEQKQQLAVKMLDKKVKLSFPLSLFQGLILKFLVNYTVTKLNNAKGHQWLTKVSEETSDGQAN